MKHAAALALLIATSLPAALAAREAPAAAACKDDAAKLCAGVQRGEGRILACLKGKSEQLSAACKSALEHAADCAQEARRICGDAAGAGDGSVKACIRKHAGEFSPACRRQR